MNARYVIGFCSVAGLALWQSAYGQGSISWNGGQAATSTNTIWRQRGRVVELFGRQTEASTNTRSWADQAKPPVPSSGGVLAMLSGDTMGPVVSRPPGVLSTTPVVVAMVCVALFCLAGAGKMFAQKNLRSARHWLMAAVVSLTMWGLMVLFIEAIEWP